MSTNFNERLILYFKWYFKSNKIIMNKYNRQRNFLGKVEFNV